MFYILCFPSLSAVYHKISHCDGPGWCRDLALVGSTILAPDSVGIHIIDVNDSNNPVYIDCYSTDEYCLQIEVLENFAYIANATDGLLILDITNPQEPQFLGNYNTPDCALSLVVRDSIVYIADRYEGLQIINVSNPYNPTLIGSYDSIHAGDIDVLDSIAIITNYYGGGFFIDISDPANPIIIDSPDNFPENFSDLVMIDSLAYIIANGKLSIYEIQDLNEMELLSYIKISQSSELSIEDDIAYIVCSYGGIQVVDVSDIYSPEYLGSFMTPGCASGIEVENSIAYTTDLYTGIEIYDVSDAVNLNLVGQIDTPHLASSISISNNIAYIADNDSYIPIIDFTDLDYPFILNSYGIFYDVEDFVISDQMGYAVTSSRFYTFSLDNLEYPEVMEYIYIGGTNLTITIDDPYAYVVSLFEGLKIIDIENPQNPYLLSTSEIPQCRFFDLVVSDEIVYLASGTKGLQIIDVSNPSNPIFLPYHQPSTLSEVYSLEKVDDILYVSCSYNGLQVVDISNPIQPHVLQTIENHPDSWFRTKPFAMNNKLIVEDRNWNELLIFDITNAENPELIGNYPWNNISYDLKSIDNHLITANGFYGVSVIYLEELTEIEDIFIPYNVCNLRNYPNPFNPYTNFSFSLSEISKVTLEIYNIKGQKVKALIKDFLPIGSHTVKWDGTDLTGRNVGNGVYFYELHFNDHLEAVNKCMLLK